MLLPPLAKSQSHALVMCKHEVIKMTVKRKGKIVYLPPERCYVNVNIEETPHGYAVYRVGADKPFTLIPTSAVKQVEYKEE